MNPRGRPTLYHPDLCAQAREHCRRGASNERLAALFGVAPRSIDNWIARLPEFAAAVNEGRAVVRAATARRLFERAIGYKETVERIVRCRGGDTQTVTYTRHHLPETRACIRYLCLRRPQNWRRRLDLPTDAPQNAVVRLAHEFAAFQPSVLDDALVAERLHQRAVGYRQTVERVFVRGGRPIVVTHTRQHPPQTQACMIWLTNRRPQNWRRVATTRSVAGQSAFRSSPRSTTEPSAPVGTARLLADGALNRPGRADDGRWARSATVLPFRLRQEQVPARRMPGPSCDHTLCKIEEAGRVVVFGGNQMAVNRYSLRHKPAGFVNVIEA